MTVYCLIWVYKKDPQQRGWILKYGDSYLRTLVFESINDQWLTKTDADQTIVEFNKNNSQDWRVEIDIKNV